MYSDPAVTYHAYVLSSQPPSHHFPNNEFELYGRRQFAELRQSVLEVGNWIWRRQQQQVTLGVSGTRPKKSVMLVGSTGAGKSYILASLATQLHVAFSGASAKQRVVFINGVDLLWHDRLHTKDQLHVAFARNLTPAARQSGDSELAARLGSLHSLDDCVRFCQWAADQGWQLYFLVDTCDVLDNLEETMATDRDVARKALHDMASRHLLVQAASAACFAARYQHSAEGQDTLFVHMDGRLTQVRPFVSCLGI